MHQSNSRLLPKVLVVPFTVFCLCLCPTAYAALSLGMAYEVLWEMQNVKGESMRALESAKLALQKGNPHNLKILTWLVESPHVSLSEKIDYAGVVLSVYSDRKEIETNAEYASAVMDALLIAWLNPQANAQEVEKTQNLVEVDDDYSEARMYRILRDAQFNGIDTAENYTRALLISRVFGNQTCEAVALLRLANSRVDQRQNFTTALEIATEIQNRRLQAKALLGLGNIRVNSRENYQEALSIAVSLADSYLQMKAHLGLGNSGEDELSNYWKAHDIAIALGDREAQFKALYGLVWVWKKKNNCPTAIHLANAAVEVAGADPRFRAKAMELLSLVSHELRKDNISMLKEGALAPAFSLVADTGEMVSLKDFKGKTVILYFYPKDMTSGCTQESCDFRDYHSKFVKKDTIILGVSKDSVESHQKFKKKYELPFLLLADPDGKVTEAYGVWKEKSMYGKKYMGIERTTFVISPEGKIFKIFSKVNVAGHVDSVWNEVKLL